MSIRIRVLFDRRPGFDLDNGVSTRHEGSRAVGCADPADAGGRHRAHSTDHAS